MLVPSASVLNEQLRRTPAECADIVADLTQAFGSLTNLREPATLADWVFVGCLLKMLCRSPLLDTHDVLTANGIRHIARPDAVILSLAGDHWPFLYRHKRCGYLVKFHPYRLRSGGRAFRQWLDRDFEQVRKTCTEIQGDYRELIDTIQAKLGAQVLILNMMSTTGVEDAISYASSEKPLAEELGAVRARELNLRLCDLARERDISIVDVDALIAEFGSRRHVRDGIHTSGPLQAAIRARIVEILHERGVPGF
jgi:hypothetical protein